MQKRSFLVLLFATLVLVAAAIYALVGGDRAVSPATEARRMFPGLSARLGDLAWIRVSRGAMKVDLNLVSGRWAVIEKGNYPAASGRMRQLLLGLADLTLVEPKTERPELFARLDLDDPSNGRSTLVTAQDRTGQTVAELIVGKARRDRLGGGSDAVYVRKQVGDRAWLARGSLDLPGDVIGWLDRSIVDIPAGRVASIALTAEDGAMLVLPRDADGRFSVADMPEDAKLKNAAALVEPAAALAGLDLDDVKPASALPVPQSGVTQAVFAISGGLTVTLRLFAHDGADWIAVAASGSGDAEKDAAALNARTARWLYAIPAARAKLLRTRLADLVEPAKGS
jgi:hypothetical protein